MTPRDGALWLPSALLLLHVPGCWSLSGPRRVTGIKGRSLSMQCQYEKEFIKNNKYWCKFPCFLPRRMVETREPEREVRSGRVSIRGHPANLTFTVTMESLGMEDAGIYLCGIHTALSLNSASQVARVVVSVFPARVTAPSPERSTSTPASLTTQPAPTRSTASQQEIPDSGQHSRSLLGSIHFLLLVFLKVPLLLGILSLSSGSAGLRGALQTRRVSPIIRTSSPCVF